MTSRACRSRDAIEPRQDLCAVPTEEGDIKGVRQAVCRMTVQGDPIPKLTPQLLPKVIAQSAHLIHRRKIARQLASFAEPDSKERTFRSRASTALVPSTVGQRLEPHATANVQSTDSLRSVNLVTRNRTKIDIELIDLNGDLAGRLSGVGVK